MNLNKKILLFVYLCFTSCSFALADEASTDPVVHTKQLYGRVDQFLTEDGPSFPGFTKEEGSAADLQDPADIPKEVAGIWHGEMTVKSARTTDACASWDANFTRMWNLFYQPSRKGAGVYKFEKSKKVGVDLVNAECVFNVSLRDDPVTYNSLLDKLDHPDSAQIAAINQVIQGVSLPLTEHQGSHSRTSEVLGEGITSRTENERVTWKTLSKNSWESDDLSKRIVSFPAPKPDEIIYTESVKRLTRESDDKLFYQSASARYDKNQVALCYQAEEGYLSRGAGERKGKQAGFSAVLLPTPGGVTINVSGGDVVRAKTVFIPGARLKR